MTDQTRDGTPIVACLVALAAALIVVGVVTGILLRHLVQMVPFAAAGVLLRRSAPAGAWAAMPLFTFWFLVAGLIWLYLLGLSDLARGTYSGLEVLCTVVMAAACVIGIWQSFRVGRPTRLAGRIVLTLGFGFFQIVAMVVSASEMFANR